MEVGRGKGVRVWVEAEVRVEVIEEVGVGVKMGRRKGKTRGEEGVERNTEKAKETRDRPIDLKCFAAQESVSFRRSCEIEHTSSSLMWVALRKTGCVTMKKNLLQRKPHRKTHRQIMIIIPHEKQVLSRKGL